MSRSGTPTLPLVLPEYVNMQSELEEQVNDPQLDPRIRNAVAAGLLKLNEYFDHAKQSHHTILATGE